MASSLVNQTSNSDTSDTQGMPHVDLDMSVSNDESDSSSEASDTESIASMTSGEDTESDEEFNNDVKFKRTKRCLKKNKRTFIPLRDRLRNLRHRRSLNLTETTDFKNVLDSLNFIESTENRTIDIPSKFFNKDSKFTSPSTEIERTESNSSVGESPGTSNSFNKKANVKSLNEQKRKIEQNKDETSENSAKSSADESLAEKIYFKKVKRNSIKTKLNTKSARVENDELSSSD